MPRHCLGEGKHDVHPVVHVVAVGRWLQAAQWIAGVTNAKGECEVRVVLALTDPRASAATSMDAFPGVTPKVCTHAPVCVV